LKEEEAKWIVKLLNVCMRDGEERKEEDNEMKRKKKYA
jgi:hypothetical protein